MIKKYWLEIIVFGLIGAGLMNSLSPNFTWMATDSDGAHYVMAAKYLTTAHHMSAPLYLLIGHVCLWLPFGSEFWRMGLISVLATVVTCILIYKCVRFLWLRDDKGRLYAIVASLIYGGSALVVSQSVIVETYTLATMCVVTAYYLVITGRWMWASVFLGIGYAVHPFLAFMAWAVLFISDKQMRNWKRFVVTYAFFAFYLYIPIVGRFSQDTGMWGNTTSSGLFGGTFGMVFMLTGGLSLWDLPKRVFDTIGILGVSFGLGIVPLIWYLAKRRGQLFWLFIIPVVYFVINLAAETYVYCLPAIAFGAIAIGVGLSKLKRWWVYAVGLCAIAYLGLNVNYFDIGRTLDPEMSAVKFYKDLDRIPDGDKFMGGGWTWAMVYVYNREEGRNIVPISEDALPSEEYLKILDGMSIRYERSESESYITKQGDIAVSIAELNEGVWIAKETKPEVYQYAIETAKGNERYIGRWIGQEVNPELKWKPSNPYKFISGQLEVSEWNHVLWVRRATGLGEMLTIIVFGIYGYGLYFLITRMMSRRRRLNGKDRALP